MIICFNLRHGRFDMTPYPLMTLSLTPRAYNLYPYP